jgi:beta-alanine--pyruvate transaminase
MEAFQKAYDTGLLLRVTGDIIALSPPLIAEPAHLTEIVERLAGVLKTVA